MLSSVQAYDYDGDGTADVITSLTQSFDSHGNVLSSVQADDYDGDGTVDAIYSLTQSFDSQGNILSSVWVYDYDGDGTAETIYSFTQSFDNHGNVLGSVEAYDHNGDGTVDDRLHNDLHGEPGVSPARTGFFRAQRSGHRVQPEQDAGDVSPASQSVTGPRCRRALESAPRRHGLGRTATDLTRPWRETMRLLPSSAVPVRTRPWPRRPTRRLIVEPLEDRLCPSYTAIDLGTLGATYTSSDASAMNASGQVVGTSSTAVSGYNHAFLWQNGVMTDLGILAGAARSVAGDINDSGQIVGGSSGTVNNTNWSHAVLWQNGIMTDLGTLGGEAVAPRPSTTTARSSAYSKTAAGDYRSFVWEDGVMYDLNALLPANSGWVTQALYGIDINDNGQIAGTGLFNGVQRAFLISDNDGIFANGGSTITNLGTLAQRFERRRTASTTSGQVVGWSNAKRLRQPARVPLQRRRDDRPEDARRQPHHRREYQLRQRDQRRRADRRHLRVRLDRETTTPSSGRTARLAT